MEIRFAHCCAHLQMCFGSKYPIYKSHLNYSNLLFVITQAITLILRRIYY